MEQRHYILQDTWPVWDQIETTDREGQRVLVPVMRDIPATMPGSDEPLATWVDLGPCDCEED